MLWKRRHIIGRGFNVNNRKIAVWVLIIFLLPAFQLIIPVTKIEFLGYSFASSSMKLSKDCCVKDSI